MNSAMLALARELETPETLVIYMAITMDGDGFEVEARCRWWLQAQFPDVRVVPGVSLTHRVGREGESRLQDVWTLLVALLVGVSLETLAARGVKRISFVDALTDREEEGFPLEGAR